MSNQASIDAFFRTDLTLFINNQNLIALTNSTRSIIAILVLVTMVMNAVAQKQDPSQHMRCGSMIRLEALLNQNPQLRAINDQNQKDAERLKKEYLSRPAEARTQEQLDMNTLTAPVYIPVVVHIVLPNALQVSDQDVQRQIDKLNIDYAGLNSDSAAIPASFKSLFGKSKIQFTLARRTPTGTLTNGIERRNSSTQSNVNLATDPIKRFSQGGLDAWDYTKYLNVWVGLDGSGLGVLGYATFPGTDAPENQGAFINAESWGNNTCYVIPAFGLGRTLVHELGHYFGLYHIWGDDGGACSGDDFRQLSGTCTVPASLLTGDTPNQADATSGCLSGVRTDACSPAAPGFMYQNYMDYTDDACYAMFTLKQVERMEYVLETCRSSYITSDGATPPTGAILNDASPVAVVNPGGFEIIGCTVTNYPAALCAGNLTPKVRIVNNGVDTLKNVKVSMVLDNGAPVVVNLATTLPLGYTTVVTFPSTNFTSGAHVLKFYTAEPNNVADQVPANDSLIVNLNVGVPSAGPVVEGFESSTFPPQGWSLSNPNLGSITWVRSTAARKSGAASAYINFYNYTNTGHLDYLVSPLVDITGADSVFVSFERAYKRYAAGATFSDTLLIQLSTACGGTTFPITAWKKGGNDLSTSPGTFTGNWAPVAADWFRERIDVKPFLPPGSTAVQVAFVAKNGYGQNLWLDDINIASVILPKFDASARNITNVAPKICAGNITPGVDIVNNGRDPLTSVRVVYRITGPYSFNLLDSVEWTGNLITGGVANVVLKPVTLPGPGTYNFLAYTKLPNGGADSLTSNDTTRYTFRYVPTLPAPVFEGFESGVFPPPNWAVVNQDLLGTWLRTNLVSRTGVASAVIDNYNYNAKGTNDDIESPMVSYSGIDSAKLTFSLSHATYYYPGSTGIPLDTLEILVAKNCGNTLTSVYKKWGEDLQTVNDPNSPFIDIFIPRSQSQWRDETVDLSSAFGTSGLAQVIIRSKGNFGNTVLIDNVNITTKTLPLKLKMNGYMISPNPFNSSFSIQHYIRPSSLRGIQVANAAGQVIIRTNFSGNAQSYINIDMSRYAAGVYQVKLIYNDKVITERVVKRS